MKKIVCLVSALLIAGLAFASTPQQKYIEQWSSTARSEMSRSGVPASITLAQGILESDSGQSDLARTANNHFGIKCHSDWDGRSVLHKAESGMECFRAYAKAEDSFRDHSDFLRYQDRYKFLFDLDPGDYRAWANGLRKAGYATDPQYPDKLVKVIENYKLYVYDVASEGGSIPASPSLLESPRKTELKFKEEQEFSLERPVYEMNGSRCIYALEGETLESIARSNGLFRGELLAYNDLKGDKALSTGEVVYLQFKKGSAPKGVDKYIVGADEKLTLWNVSQRFGMKLNTLRKLNPAKTEGVLSEGETVLLKKSK